VEGVNYDPIRVAWLLALAAASVAACDAPLAEQQVIYQACGGVAERCGDGSICLRGAIGSLAQCSRECLEDTDCPSSDVGQPRCHRFIHGSYCVLGCTDDDACADGTSCEDLDTVAGEEVSLCAH
jgi:hypothetical protein